MIQGIFDTHSHLNDKQFKDDIPGTLRRAALEGVNWVICPGYDMPSSRIAAQIAEKHTNVWATVGIHPHDAKTLSDDFLAELAQLTSSPKVVAIGEIGLDFFRDLSPRSVQENAFRRQLQLAKELGLPIVIHDRDAGTDLIRIIEDEGTPPAGGVLHCFSEDVDYALRAVELGFYIGIAGPVTFSKNQVLKDVVQAVPEDRLLVETDAPYLTPEPFRGRRKNEPALVRIVAEKVAELKGTDLSTIAQITTANTLRLFKRITGIVKPI